MGPYQRTPKKVARAIKYPGLGVRWVGPVGDFLDIYMWSQNSSHDSKIRILEVGMQARRIGGDLLAEFCGAPNRPVGQSGPTGPDCGCKEDWRWPSYDQT